MTTHTDRAADDEPHDNDTLHAHIAAEDIRLVPEVAR